MTYILIYFWETDRLFQKGIGKYMVFIPLVKQWVTKYQHSRKVGALTVSVSTDELVKMLFSKQDTGQIL